MCVRSLSVCVCALSLCVCFLCFSFLGMGYRYEYLYGCGCVCLQSYLTIFPCKERAQNALHVWICSWANPIGGGQLEHEHIRGIN